MGYAKLDDGFWRNEKLESVSDKAHRLYVRAISLASDMNTDGLITPQKLRFLGAKPAGAAELVRHNLWEATPDGWLIHDYVEHNRTAEERSAQGRKGSDARWGKRKGDAASNAPSNAASMPSAYAQHSAPNAYTDQSSTDTEQSKGRAAHQASMPDPPPPLLEFVAADPPEVREVAEQILQTFSRSLQADPPLVDECYEFARQFPGQQADVGRAISRVRQQNGQCYPRNLRPHMPGWQQPERSSSNGTSNSNDPGPVFPNGLSYGPVGRRPPAGTPSRYIDRNTGLLIDPDRFRQTAEWLAERDANRAEREAAERAAGGDAEAS